MIPGFARIKEILLSKVKHSASTEINSAFGHDQLPFRCFPSRYAVLNPSASVGFERCNPA